jgi:hypothetical protein
MRRLLIVVVVALGLPPAAQAKELTGLTLCGQSGCDSAKLGGFHESPVQYSTSGLPAPPPSSFYLLGFGIDGQEGVANGIYYEPRSGLVAMKSGLAGWVKWFRLSPSAGTAAKDLARRLEPFPSPTVTEVKIGKRVVREGAHAYLRLVELEGPYVLGQGTAIGIRLTSSVESPWTAGSVLYYPDNDVLLNGPASSVRVPAEIAAQLEGTPRGDGWTVPWIAIGTALAGAFALLLLARRRPPEGKVAPVH